MIVTYMYVNIYIYIKLMEIPGNAEVRKITGRV